jgi:hypothetical protein
MKTLRLIVVVLFFVSILTSVSEAGVSKKQNSVPKLQRNHLKTVSILGQETSLIHENTLDGWTTLGGKKPNEAWSVSDGVLHLKGKGGDMMSEREYKNFVLDFTWTIAKGGNSGIKYRFKKIDGKGWYGCEYQVLDDFNTGEGKKAKNNAATLYDILPTNNLKVLNPNDNLNHGRIVVNGNHIEHWLNGVKVVDVWVGSKTWKEGIAASKFKEIPNFGKNAAGHIMVQDHGCEVWFHDISIREIVQTPAKTFVKRKKFCR